MKNMEIINFDYIGKKLIKEGITDLYLLNDEETCTFWSISSDISNKIQDAFYKENSLDEQQEINEETKLLATKISNILGTSFPTFYPYAGSMEEVEKEINNLKEELLPLGIELEIQESGIYSPGELIRYNEEQAYTTTISWISTKEYKKIVKEKLLQIFPNGYCI